MNKIFKNSFFNFLQVLIVTPIFFILVPYYISRIGVEGYGIFALVGVISSYQVFVEMGLTTTLVRFVAKAVAGDDNNAISEYLATALGIYLVISACALGLIFIFIQFVTHAVLGISLQYHNAMLLVQLSAITAITNLISGLFKSIIDGVQRMDISNSILTIQVIISALGNVIMLELGYGLVGLSVSILGASLLSLIANIVFSRRVVRYKVNLLKFSKSRFKEMFRYSVNLQLSALISFWIEPVNKILISHFLGISFVGFYDIALKFSSRLTNLIRSILMPIFPASAEIFEKKGSIGIEALKIKSLKYIFPVISIVYSLGISVTYPFVNLWLGPNFIIVSVAIIILLAGSYISILATPSYIILMGAGFTQDTLKIQAQTIVVNIITVLISLKMFGFYGFCIGYTVSTIYTFFITNYAYRKRFLSVTNFYFSRERFKPIVTYLTVMVTGILVLWYAGINSWPALILFSIILLAINIIVTLKFRILTENDFCSLFGKQTFGELIFNKPRK